MKKLITLLLLVVTSLSAAIQYSGGTIVNTTYTADGNRQNLLNAIEDNLNTAGWTTSSGHHTATVVMVSATTPTANNTISIDLRDTGGNSVFIRIRNAAGSILSRNHYLIPTNGHVYRIIANKYTAAIFVPTSTASREFVIFGTLWIPTWLQGVETNELGWIVSNADSDGDTTVRESFRSYLSAGSNNSNQGEWSGIVNAQLQNMQTTAGAASMRLVPVLNSYPATGGNASAIQWHDATYLVSDPLLAWGAVNSTDPALV